MRANFAVGRRTDVPLVVLVIRRIGTQVLSLRAAEAILFFFVNESAGQIFAVSDSTTPEWNESPFALLLQRADDGCRTVTPVCDRFTNRDLASLFDPLQLLQIRLIVVPRARGDFRIEDSVTIDELKKMTFLDMRKKALPLRLSPAYA